jgi:hypothetical protein
MYSQTWNKYLPVIRILLKRAATAPQQTGLNKTDFETGGSRTRKLSCSFSIQLERGRLTALTNSVAAKDLVAILQQDDVVAALMQRNGYEISLNASFQLTVSMITPLEAAAAEPAVADELTSDVAEETSTSNDTIVAEEGSETLLVAETTPVEG